MSEGRAPPERAAEGGVSRRYAFRPGHGWDGVPTQRYKPRGDDWAGVVRQVLIGHRERTAFHVRYFELAPGGYSSLEKHAHAHAVTCVRGRGQAVVGDQLWPMEFLDTIYVAPDTPHQFINAGEEPFGFLCVVDAERDRPQPLSAAELDRLRRSGAVGPALREGRPPLRAEPGGG